MLFILIGLLFALVILQSIYVRKVKYRALRNLPGPPSNWLWGSLFQFGSNNEDPFENFKQLNKAFGRVVPLWINPWKPLVVVSHPGIIEKILSTNTHLSKTSLYKFLEPLIGDALPSANVAIWKRYRKMTNPAFQPRIFQTFLPILEHHGDKLIDILKNKNDQSDINLPDLVDPYALDTICELMLNVRTHFQESANNAYLKAKATFLSIFMNRAYSLLKRSNFLFAYTSEYKISEASVAITCKFAEDMVNVAKDARMTLDAPDINMEPNKTVIDFLLDGATPEYQLRNEIASFLTAGHDTTGTTIAFTLFLLASHPEIQAKVVKEVVSVSGNDFDTVVSLQDLKNMTYLECVIKETLRYFSIVPAHERLLEEDIAIDGIVIPKGTEVAVSIYGVHHDEEYHPNPYVFNPDRFLPENQHKIHPYTFIPFSKGPRDCIGKTLAMMWIKHAIAKVVRRFELLPLAVPHTLKLGNSFVIKSLNGVPVRMKRRVW